MKLAGGPEVELLREPLGQPRWPRGWGGSITHDSGIAAAVAYPIVESYANKAIDIIGYRNSTTVSESSSAFVRPDEVKFLRNYFLTTALFSAKEVAVKIISPALNEYIDPFELKGEMVRGGVLVNYLNELSVSVCITQYRGGWLSAGILNSTESDKRCIDAFALGEMTKSSID